jgi:hypothetical protein
LENTPEKPVRATKRKDAAKAPSAGSNIERPPMIPDEVMSGLPKTYHDLHRMLMGQPCTAWEINYKKWLFNHEDDQKLIALRLANIMEVYKNEWLGIQIMQIWCMYVLPNLIT